MPHPANAVVIGGGPAGSAAALLLTRAGWAVTLIEQHRFPRDKVCGECVSALGFDVFTRLGLRERFLFLGAVPLHFATLHAPGGRSARLKLPRPMFGLSRRAMDPLLLDAAREAGANIRQPARCEAIDAEPSLSIRVRDLTTNVVATLRPTWVIVADGKAALAGRSPAATDDFGIKTHFANVAGPTDAIELFSAGGTYGGLAPIEAGHWNAAFSVPAGLLRQHRGDLDALFAGLVAANPALRQRLTTAARVGPWVASPLPRFAVTADAWPAGVVPVGNAAAALEPIGGEGMGLALRSAELAADALLRAGADVASFDRTSLSRAYDALWRQRRFACRTAARIVSSPRLADPAIRLAAASEPVGRAVLAWMGKRT